MENLDVGKNSKSVELADRFYSLLKSGVRVEKETHGFIFDFEWLSRMEETSPYIDKIFANPKRFIVNEELILDVAKSKKVTQESVKHLAKHSNLISTYDEETDELTPNKLLNVLKEDTYNTYENRFIYTLVGFMETFIRDVLEKMQKADFSRKEKLMYKANTNYNGEIIKCQLQINDDIDASTTGSTSDVKPRIEKMLANISQWKHTEVYESLDGLHVPKVSHPIRRTNVILKNPDFQQAVILWDFLYNYLNDMRNSKDENKIQNNLDITLNKFLENGFLINYLVLKYANATSDVQKETYKRYMKELGLRIFRTSVDIIKSSGDEVQKDELIEIINEQLTSSKIVSKMDYASVEHKIKNSIRDYIGRIEDSYFIIGDEEEVDEEEAEEEETEYENS